MKTQKHQKNMKPYNVNQQLITDAIKPSKEKDEICAAQAALVFHGVKHRHSYLVSGGPPRGNWRQLPHPKKF